MNDPFIKADSVKETATGWEWETTSGVRIVSCLPPMYRHWWDEQRYHLFWSYASWSTLLLAQAGTLADERDLPTYVGRSLKFPRKYLKSKGWW